MLSNLVKKRKSIEKIIFYSILLFLPTQFGRHFWPLFSFVNGLKIDYLSPTLYFTDLLIIVLFITSLNNLWTKKKLIINNLFFFSLLILFLGTIFSKNQYSALYGILKFLEFSFFVFYVSQLSFKKEILKISLIFSLEVFLESILSFVQYFSQRSVGGILYFFGERTFSSQTPGIANASLAGELVLRPYGTFSHPNVLAGFLLVAMVIILFALRKTNKGKFIKLILYLSLSLGFFSLILTMSRLAILLWFLILTITGVAMFRKKIKRKAGLILLFLTMLGVGMFFTFLRFRFFEISIRDEFFTQRIDLLKSSILMFKSSSILGVGLNNFLVNLPFFQVSQGNVFLMQPVHNIYFLILSETGFVGLLFFLIFLKRALFAAKKKQFLLPLLCVLALGLVDHYFLTLQQGQLLFATVLGLCFTGFRKD